VCYNLAMAAGRPSEYDPIKVAKATSKYIEDCKNQFYLPTVEGLAVHLCVARSTIYEWAKTYPEFSDILEALLAAQGSQLIQNGLKGEYNSTITKLMLTKHGYKDKTDVTTDDKPIEAIIGMRVIKDNEQPNQSNV
jgi:DNA-packaging protein gp3